MPDDSVPYLLVFRHARPEGFAALPPAEKEALWQQWRGWYESLAAAGKVAGANPLQQSGRVVSGARGERVIDGPFAEAKEAIGGYFLLNVSGLDEATAIARQAPTLAADVGLSIEIRPVAPACPFLCPQLAEARAA